MPVVSATGCEPSYLRKHSISDLQVDEEANSPNRSKGATAGMDSLFNVRGTKSLAVLERDRQETLMKVKALRKQLQRQRKRTLDPHSKLMQRWDLVTTVALVFTASVTPFEVCILNPPPAERILHDPLAWMNRLVDIVFIMDIIVQCFMSYQESATRGGSWVYDLRKIISRYARSWMALDVITAIPVDVILAAWELHNRPRAVNFTAATNLTAGNLTAGTSTERSGGGADALRIVRMIRLVKLGRIVRTARVLRRWQARLALSFAKVALMQCAGLVVVTAHWLACFWCLVGRSSLMLMDDTTSDSALGGNWISRAGLAQATPAELYGVAINVAICSITPASSSVGPTNTIEFYLISIANVIGSCTWAYIISTGCGLVSNLNPARKYYRNVMVSTFLTFRYQTDPLYTPSVTTNCVLALLCS